MFITKQCPVEYPHSAAKSWQKAQCYANLTYVFNDGTEDVVDKRYYSDTASNGYVVELPTPTRDGYEFDGWYADSALTQPVTNSTVFAGDKTLYAKWTRAEFVCESGMWLHIGDDEDNTNKICLYDNENKPAAPRIAIETPSGVRYLMLSEDTTLPLHEGSNKKMHVEIRGKVYNVHDGSSGE